MRGRIAGTKQNIRTAGVLKNFNYKNN